MRAVLLVVAVVLTLVVDEPNSVGWLLALAGVAALASVENDPKNAAYRYHLGLAYAKKGDKRKARDAFDEALKLQPGLKAAAEARSALSTS